MKKSEADYFITRHSKPGKGVEDLPGLSVEGVELAKERAEVIAELIRSSKAGSVILFGGVTSAVRTRSTMELYVSEAEKILTAENDGVSFLKTEEIKALASESGYSSAAKDLVSKINLMPEQKVVIDNGVSHHYVILSTCPEHRESMSADMYTTYSTGRMHARKSLMTRQTTHCSNSYLQTG
jgi:hypothetical protein